MKCIVKILNSNPISETVPQYMEKKIEGLV
jgi:hypothetical protein